MVLAPLPPTFLSLPIDDVFLIFLSKKSSSCVPSGEAEGKDERRAQQAPLRHRGQAAVRVQREAAAPPEGEDGRPGGKGDPLSPRKMSHTVSVSNLNSRTPLNKVVCSLTSPHVTTTRVTSQTFPTKSDIY